MQSCEALATKAELETKASNSFVELKVAGAAATAVIAKELASGNAQWINVKGAKVATALPTLISKTSAADAKAAKAALDALASAGQKASKALSTGTSALAKAGSALGAIGNIFSVLGTFATLAGLALLTKKVVEHRKDFLEYKEKNDRITQKNAFIAKNAESKASTNKLELEKQNQQIAANRNTANEALHTAKTNKTQIDQIKLENQNTRNLIETKASDLNQRIDNLQKQVAEANTNNAEVNALKDKVNNISNQVNNLGNIRNQVIDTENRIRNLQANYPPSLANDVRTNTNVRTTLLTGYEVIKAQQDVVGDTITDITSQVDQLTNNPPSFNDGELDEIIDNKIDTKLPALIEENMPNEQLDNMQTDLGLILAAVALLPLIKTGVDKVPKLTCQAPALVPPVRARVEQNIGLTNALQGVTIAQGEITRQAVNSTRSLINTVQSTANTIKNTLDTTKQFMEKAWESTRINKVLDIVNTALLVHNAAMLSTNLVSSLGDILSSIVNNSINLIKKEDGSNIDINAVVGGTVESFLKRIIGTETYTNLNENFQKTSRIINAAANIVNTFQSSLSGIAQGLETVGNYTGKIGNSLKAAGIVFENSYNWMSERFTVKTGKLGQVQKVIDNLEQAENVLSDFENVTQELVEVTDNVSQINKEFNNIKEEISLTEEESKTEAESNKANSQGAQPEAPDYTPDPIN